MSTHIWLRAESKPNEQRTALTPQVARQLLDAGYRLTVEDSACSAIPSSEFASAGCEIAEPHSWKESAPPEALILGLKELEDGDTPIVHRHIHFAHVYKNQSGWQNVLRRFSTGGGTLYDLEYLVDEDGRRVAAFGHWAGFAGAGLAALAWARQQQGTNPPLDSISSRSGQQVLVDEIIGSLDELGKRPKAMVIGALGRSGRGAVQLLEAIGAEVIAWDLEETQRGGPFAEILEADILLNCVFVQRKIPPFLTREMLDDANRRLSIVCDVSCDPYGNYNPLPIYDKCTTFDDPILRLIDGPKPLDLIAIDHLPSLLPVESSHDFCEQLLPHLLQLNKLDQGVWHRAHEVFQQKTAMAQRADGSGE